MRFGLSLLISTNVHVWTVVLVSLTWPHSAPVLPPEPVEVQLLKIPALPEPGDGGEVAKRERRIKPREQSGPSVEYRVTISSRESPQTAPLKRSSSADLLASDDIAVGKVEQRSIASAAGIEGAIENNLEDRLDLNPGGDPRPLVEIIQARIDEITPLVHRTSGLCRYEQGIIKIRFRISRYGYTETNRIVRSSGPACLEEAAEKVLHLAEPYPYVAGWVPVTIKFTL
jgi:hypothetical protein